MRKLAFHYSRRERKNESTATPKTNLNAQQLVEYFCVSFNYIHNASLLQYIVMRINPSIAFTSTLHAYFRDYCIIVRRLQLSNVLQHHNNDSEAQSTRDFVYISNENLHHNFFNQHVRVI